MMTNEQILASETPGRSDLWTDLIQQHIVEGKIPTPRHHWEVETPETYLAGRYTEAGQPEALRSQLISVLKNASMRNDGPVLGRALRLATFIPHVDFDGVLQEIYFKVRSTGLHTQYGDAALQVFRTMHALQSELPKEKRRADWWLYLVEKDAEYGIAAYQGLRDLDPLLALSHLDLLLQRDDLPAEGLEVLLDGVKEDALRAKANEQEQDEHEDRAGPEAAVEQIAEETEDHRGDRELDGAGQRVADAVVQFTSLTKVHGSSPLTLVNVFAM